MADLRSALERLMVQLDPPSSSYERFSSYRHRRSMHRKLVAAGFGLVVGSAGLIGLILAFALVGDDPVSPSQSAESGSILFAGSQEGADDIWVMQPDGSGLRNLTRTSEVSENQPSWSPEGSRIAFVNCLECTSTDIFVMNADGTEAFNVTQDEAYDGAPAWAPDGSMIAYHSDAGPTSAAPADVVPPGHEDIFLINPDGSGRLRLTDTPERELSPSWSPDGAMLAFVGLQGTETSSVFVMNADGSDRVRLTDPSMWVHESVSWSSDGSRLAFVALDRESASEYIYVMNADGTGLTRITDGSAVGSPSWAPNGDRLVYATSGAVYVVDLDGTSSQTYVAPSGDVADATWSATIVGTPVPTGDQR